MTRSSFFGNKNYQSANTDRVIAEGGSKFTAKVFLYMFIAIAITAVTTLLAAFGLEQVLTTGNEAGMDAVGTIAVVTTLLYIPIFIWIEISILRGGKGLGPAFVIYSIMMGTFISPIIALLNISGLLYIVGIAFGLTCGSFGIMALIAWNSKRNLSNLAIIGYGLISGIFLISLMSMIVYLIAGVDFALLSGLVSAGFFIFIILITVVDLYNIRRIAARGEASSNLAMVCAFSLYTDFVYIFIRLLLLILRLMALFSRRN